MALRTLLVAASAAAALASCPNNCNNNGYCGSSDVCVCYEGYGAADCSQRACPFGNSWALDSSRPHDYEECSGAGICDREKGVCKCFEQFTGSACQRRACPNACSGHGKCLPLGELSTTVPLSGDAWEATQVQGCQCDPGYFGPDCSQRRCATGDDPLTICSSTNKQQVQEVIVRLGSGLTTALDGSATSYPEGMSLFGVSDVTTLAAQRADASSGHMTLAYTDVFGDAWQAPAAAKAVFAETLAGANAGAASIKVALESIPNQKVDAVTVVAAPDTSLPSSVLGQRFLVTFTGSSNIGNQGPLQCGMKPCSKPGCAPMVKPAFLYRYAAAAQRPSFDAATSYTRAFSFYAGASATETAFTAGSYIRLASTASPALPLGVAADTGVTTTSLQRYDVRVVVAVQDPPNANANNDAVDVFWYKVVYGHTNITADTFEYDNVNPPSGTAAGPWSSTTQSRWTGSLLGFTYGGAIPATKTVSLPDHAGIDLEFPARDIVNVNTEFRFFEIVIKLSTCQVTALVKGGEFTGVGGAALTPVDPNVENVECSARGQCDRSTGQCVCFDGFTGQACSTMTTMV